MLKTAMSRRLNYLDQGELHSLADGVLSALKRQRIRLSLRRPWIAPKALPRDTGTIADWRWDTVELACLKCNRQGAFDLESLKQQLGADVDLAGLAIAIARVMGCPDVNPTTHYDRCQAMLPQLRRAVADFESRKPPNFRR